MVSGEATMKIEIVKMEFFGYSLIVDGEVLMECLTERDVDELTIKEIKELERA